jgi:hypothetical protein
VEAVTFGKEHHFEPGRFRLAWLRGLLPLVPWRPTEQFYPEEALLAFWITRRDPVTGRYLNLDEWSGTVALDRHGCAFPEKGRQVFWSDPMRAAGEARGVSGPATLPRAPAGYRYIGGYAVWRNFPRRDPRFRLLFYGKGGRRMAEFLVQNPAATDVPPWRPEPVPATRQVGDLAVTLQRTSGEMRRYGDEEPPRYHFRSRFTFVQGGRPTRDWEALECRFGDATGNDARVGNPGHAPTRLPLCRFEPAWQLRAKVARTPRADFGAHERWSVRDLDLPAAGAARRLEEAAIVQGVSLRLLAVSGPGSTTYDFRQLRSPSFGGSRDVGDALTSLGPGQGRGFEDSSHLPKGSTGTNPLDAPARRDRRLVTFASDRWPHIALDVFGLEADQWITARATDERGRTTAGRFTANEWSEGWVVQFIQLPVARDAGRLNLTFAVQRPREVVFTFRPPRPAAAPAP